MIEVNLHPGGAKGGATARRSLRLPSFGRGGPSASGRDPWTIAAIAVPAVVLLAIGWMWFSARSHRAELNDRIAVAVEQRDARTGDASVSELGDLRSQSFTVERLNH